jgi:hypothetical protein
MPARPDPYEDRHHLGLEDVASYDMFFSTRESHAMVTGDWSVLDVDDEDFEEQWPS